MYKILLWIIERLFIHHEKEEIVFISEFISRSFDIIK